MSEGDRDLDRWLAEHVMGWAYCSTPGIEDFYTLEEHGYDHIIIPSAEDWSPSTRIDHAWMVVERMRELGWRLNLADWDNSGRCAAGFSRRADEPCGGIGLAPTAPLAICRAAKEALS